MNIDPLTISISAIVGALSLITGWGVSSMFQNRQYSALRDNVKDNEKCLKNLIQHVTYTDSKINATHP